MQFLTRHFIAACFAVQEEMALLRSEMAAQSAAADKAAADAADAADRRVADQRVRFRDCTHTRMLPSFPECQASHAMWHVAWIGRAMHLTPLTA